MNNKLLSKIWSNNQTCVLLIILLSICALIALQKNDLCAFYFQSVSDQHKELEFIQLILAMIVIIGSIWTYLRLRKQEQNDFLFLKIKVKEVDGIAAKKILTKLINPVNATKKVDFACLTISKQINDFNPQKATNKETQNRSYKNNKADNDHSGSNNNLLKNLCILTGYSQELNATNEIIKLKPFSFAYSRENSIAFIPLPFYFEENIQYGNERVSYSYLFDKNFFCFDPGVYSVRFFVFRADGGYHRCVHDVFTIV